MQWFLLFAITGFAQEIQVSGTFIDDKLTPLPGVSVQVSGTDKGTITNLKEIIPLK